MSLLFLLAQDADCEELVDPQEEKVRVGAQENLEEVLGMSQGHGAALL